MSRETSGAGSAVPSTDWEAVARYLAGESSAAEQATVRRWLAEHPADAKTIGALDDALAGLTLKPEAMDGIDVEAALASVKARRDQSTLGVIRGATPARKVSRIPGRSTTDWRIVAAAAAVLVTIGALVWREAAPTGVESTVAARTLSTPVGARDSLVLPDGSQVILGPGSELLVAAAFGQAERRVSLRGEALFTIVHDDARPFIVEANGASIRDVGTAFVVHSDAGGARVAVTEGVVELTPSSATPAAKTTLNAGDAATVTPSGVVRTERGVGATADLAWTLGKLVFRDTPLSEVSEDLRRWYGVHLDIQDPALRRRPFSGTFQGDSLRAVLDALGPALGATMERRGDTVVVRSMPR